MEVRVNGIFYNLFENKKAINCFWSFSISFSYCSLRVFLSTDYSRSILRFSNSTNFQLCLFSSHCASFDVRMFTAGHVRYLHGNAVRESNSTEALVLLIGTGQNGDKSCASRFHFISFMPAQPAISPHGFPPLHTTTLIQLYSLSFLLFHLHSPAFNCIHFHSLAFNCIQLHSFVVRLGEVQYE